MKKNAIQGLPLWQFESFLRHDGIAHFVSGRAGGQSRLSEGGLNLSYKVGDDSDLVTQNRGRLAKAFSLSTEKLLFPVQTHSNHVKLVNSTTPASELEDTDALITNERGMMIAVMSADCVPILLYAPDQKVVAAIHAGWRGTVGEIVKNTIHKMTAEFGVRPASMIAAIGPSICDEVYEVGEEVISAVERVYGTTQGIIRAINNGKGFCNLWEANRIQLLQSGVKAENIEVAGICTFQNAEEFFSYRKEGSQAGRFAAGIALL